MPILKASGRIPNEERFTLQNNKDREEPFFFIQGTELNIEWCIVTVQMGMMEYRIRNLIGTKRSSKQD